MGKRVHSEFSLPEAIIQSIQSFMDGKDAARTAILSKSWYAAWKTCPNLHFDQRGFMRNPGDRCSESRFWEFVNRTVQRYENLNLKIETLCLWIYGTYSDKSSSYYFANKLILKALKLGMVDLDFSINYRQRLFELPHEVLGSENLVRLSVNGCKIGLGANGKIKCLRLRSLCLENVWLEGDIIWDIVSRCPLIENLSLSSCRFLFGYQNSNDAVAHFTMLSLSPFLEFGKRNVGSVLGGPIIPYEIRNLKCLTLCKVNVHTLFFDEFSSRFPCLTELGLHNCDNYREIQISSPSLECIDITHGEMLRVKLGVPSIRKFIFSSGYAPSLSFKTGRTNWESDISLTCDSRCPSFKWFRELNTLLKKLTASRVSLSIKVLHWNRSKHARNIRGLPRPLVENLSVEAPSSACPALIDCLIQCCRPIFVTQLWLGSIGGESNMEFVYKRLMHQINLDFVNNESDHSVVCQDELEEVSVEVFNEVVSGWRTLPWKTVVGASIDEQRIRFRLRWGQEPAAFGVGKKGMARLNRKDTKAKVFKPKPLARSATGLA